MRDLVLEFAIPESPNWLLLGSLDKASAGPNGTAGIARADLARGLAEAQDRAFGIKLHLS